MLYNPSYLPATGYLADNRPRSEGGGDRRQAELGAVPTYANQIAFMTKNLKAFDKKATASFSVESEVEAYADAFLRPLGYELKHKKTGNPRIDKCWPSKTADPRSAGKPDILVYVGQGAKHPFCVWENKSPSEPISDALAEAKFYIDRLHDALPSTPGLPRLAAGFNGRQLKLSYLNYERKWIPVRLDGNELVDHFPFEHLVANGISSTGNLLAAKGTASAADLRAALPALKTIYRSIPILAAGRRPIDFTVGLLTIRMLVEMDVAWGTWAEQPSLVADALSTDQAIAERLSTLVERVFSNTQLKRRYGDIFRFQETGHNNEEVAFSFEDCLAQIGQGYGLFESMFSVLDMLPPLHGADFDVFGEVYQAIGDDATKRALGEFFTGRHIISAVVPVLFDRAGLHSFDNAVKSKTIADIACGTGGFLTETLRYVRRRYQLDEAATKDYAAKAFYGYDLSHSNASRARVNMYFAGDGFSTIDGGIDSLADADLRGAPRAGFDFILTNPPYGQSAQYQRLHEAFLFRMISLLKPGTGWGLIVLPTGTLENPRSSQVRLRLMRSVRITDIVSLPQHAFAPYTKQRTAIAIFQRRESDLAATTWPELVGEVGHEAISYFVVDNDGYANSDKRYPTSRVATDGRWLHNDLAEWVSLSDGKKHASKLFDALINAIVPVATTDEAGVPTDGKYGRLTIEGMAASSVQPEAEMQRGLSLMPDTYLRPPVTTLSYTKFVKITDQLIQYARGASVSLPLPFAEMLKSLLMSPVSFGNGKRKVPTAKVSDIFDLAKGDQGLTEAVMYNHFDPKGLWAFGGGEALPRFRISRKTVTKSGKPLTHHSGPALVVAMDGSSGAVRVIKDGEFCANHHACILTPKSDADVNLYFAAQQMEGGLRALSSNKESSATLTLPSLSNFCFETTTDREKMRHIAARRKILAYLRDRFL